MRFLTFDASSAFGQIYAPEPAKPFTDQGGQLGLQLFFTNLINIIYAGAALIFIFMIIFGAFQMISSGGDKEGVAKARARITYAIIGMIVLALTFVILQVLGGILHFSFFHR